MKIYRKIKLKIDTWETLYEDSYEYEGPIAHCIGGGQRQEQIWTPQTQQLYNAVQPHIGGFMQQAMQPPDFGSPYAQQLNQSLMAQDQPTVDRYMNQLGRGDSARAGYSGTTAAGLADLEAQLANQRTTQMAPLLAQQQQLAPSYLGAAQSVTPTTAIMDDPASPWETAGMMGLASMLGGGNPFFGQSGSGGILGTLGSVYDKGKEVLAGVGGGLGLSNLFGLGDTDAPTSGITAGLGGRLLSMLGLGATDVAAPTVGAIQGALPITQTSLPIGMGPMGGYEVAFGSGLGAGAGAGVGGSMIGAGTIGVAPEAVTGLGGMIEGSIVGGSTAPTVAPTLAAGLTNPVSLGAIGTALALPAVGGVVNPAMRSVHESIFGGKTAPGAGEWQAAYDAGVGIPQYGISAAKVQEHWGPNGPGRLAATETQKRADEAARIHGDTYLQGGRNLAKTQEELDYLDWNSKFGLT